MKTKTYLVSYDLTRPLQNYQRIAGRLIAHGAEKVLLSQWALSSTWTAVQLRDDLKAFMDLDDRLLVTEIGDWAAYNVLSTDKLKKIAS